MKSLKHVLEVSLLDIDSNLDITDEEAVKDAITKFINDNYDCKKFTISNKPNKDSKFEVSSNDYVKVKNNNITSLTNDLFVWNKVGESFYCASCNSLKSLEGSPKEVVGFFSCNRCNSLKSLEGAPKEVKGHFSCSYCESLQSLNGAPEKVRDGFYCRYCNSLKSLEGAPKEVKGDFDCSFCDYLKSLEGAPKEVKGDFDCSNCKSLKSLEYSPKEVRGYFNCEKCKVQFEESDVRAVSDVKEKIYV